MPLASIEPVFACLAFVVLAFAFFIDVVAFIVGVVGRVTRRASYQLANLGAKKQPLLRTGRGG